MFLLVLFICLFFYEEILGGNTRRKAGKKFIFQIEIFLFMTPGILSFVFRSESSYATCEISHATFLIGESL